MMKPYFVDMDGVLCDFHGAAAGIHKKKSVLNKWPAGEWDIAKVFGMTEHEFWEKINWLHGGFWATLYALPWYEEVLSLGDCVKPEKMKPVMLSSPSRDAYSVSGKISWMRQHFGVDFEDWNITPCKANIAYAGAILIDDSDLNIAEWEEQGGNGILFPQPWNANNGLIGERMAYVTTIFGMHTRKEQTIPW